MSRLLIDQYYIRYQGPRPVNVDKMKLFEFRLPYGNCASQSISMQRKNGSGGTMSMRSDSQHIGLFPNSRPYSSSISIGQSDYTQEFRAVLAKTNESSIILTNGTIGRYYDINVGGEITEMIGTLRFNDTSEWYCSNVPTFVETSKLT